MICTDIAAPSFFLFSAEAPSLLYYSHVPTLLISLLLGFFVFKHNRNSRALLLFVLTILFSTWIVFDLILWTSVNSSLITFTWSLYGILQPLVFLVAFLFFYTYIKQKTPPTYLLLLLSAAILPGLLFNFLNTAGFSLANCESYDDPSGWFFFYGHGVELLMLAATAIFGLTAIVCNKGRRTEFTFLTLGISFFLLLFSGTGFLASYLADNGYENSYEIEFYGLFAMTFFLGLLSYLITKFKAFSIKVIGAQMLVAALIFMVGSLLFVVKSQASQIVSAFTLIFTSAAGYFLVRSVKREVKQREEIQQLAGSLANANERLKELDKAKSEFVSIASHQLRSPLTAIRGYASMLAEGSFGQLPVKAAESAKRIEDSAKLMAMSIEDYLNVSRIESGNMKYNLSDFNLVEMTSKLCDDLRPEAMQRNLILLFRSDIKGKGIVNADIGKTNQIIHNLINNSIKYTPKGSINVFMHDDSKKKRIYIDITDTGIGMSQETISKLFGKFSRANNANSVNTSGTGLGLYVALKMAEAMGGSITCTSEGDTKGSTFTFELPMAM